MATWDKGTSKFTCPKCGAKYKCDYDDFPSRSKGSHDCDDCGAVIHSWNGTRDYDGCELVEHGPGWVPKDAKPNLST